MSGVKRYSVQKLKDHVQVVEASDYDALAQQLADSEIRELNDKGALRNACEESVRLRRKLAARNKQLIEAAELLDETWNINQDAYDEEELHDRVNAFLTTIEQDKANDQ